MAALTTDSHPMGNSRSARSRRDSGRRSPLYVRFAISVEETTEEAVDHVVESASLAVMIETAARVTMQPLPRAGNARFFDLKRRLRMGISDPPHR
jgi:hypothetical protein